MPLNTEIWNSKLSSSFREASGGARRRVGLLKLAMEWLR